MCNYAGIAAETGLGMSVRAHDMPTKEFDRTMAINTRGAWLCCKYALKQMLEQEPREANARGEKTRGWIVNAASILGLVGFPATPCYSKNGPKYACCYSGQELISGDFSTNSDFQTRRRGNDQTDGLGLCSRQDTRLHLRSLL